MAKKEVIQTAKHPEETYVSFLLDETGSMLDCYDATISGFNEYIENLKKDKVKFTLTKFNSNKIEIVYDSEPIKKVKKLTKNTFRPDAMTPLYDAIYNTIKAVEEKKPAGKVLLVIMTDGMENCSKQHSRKDVFDLIQNKENSGWAFVFLGAGQDAWSGGFDLGIRKDRILNYHKHQTFSSYNKLIGSTRQYLAAADIQSANDMKFFDQEEDNDEESKNK